MEASDGSVYFLDVSTKFGYGRWVLYILEAKPYERILKYDPILLDGLGFANVVSFSS